MPLIKWKKDFELGIASVDHEHREMIELINNLFENLSEGASENEIISFLGEIYAKISAHFALEEREMRDINYPGYAAHKEDHEDLLDEIRDVMDGFEEGEYEGFKGKLEEQLESWFGKHFKDKDSLLHLFLQTRS